MKVEACEKAIEKKVEAYEKENEKRYEVLETKIKTLVKVIDGKDEIITNIEKKFTKLLLDKNVIIEAIEKKLTNFENKVCETNVAKEKEDKLNCPHCDFKTNLSQGLKVHLKRKHTSYADVSPERCEICDYTFKDYMGKPWGGKQIESHMITHSIKSSGTLNYKCIECDFWGSNILTMEVHMKKNHSEKIKCGLCDCEFKSIESLDTHLQTCETYRCFDCDNIFITLEGVKEHVTQQHSGENVSFKHSKSDRFNADFFVDKNYNFKELFGRKK